MEKLEVINQAYRKYLDLTDKVKKLIENDVKRRTNTLLSAETELTSHNPTESSVYREAEEKK